MYTPTHVQVTVHRARGLIAKGKGGNDTFATVGLGKEKFSTSIREKTVDPQWHEECDFEIPSMDVDIKINIYHRNLMGLDEFLGQLLMPLRDFDMYDTPKSTWYSLRSKPGKKGPQKNRGEVAVKVAFVVRSKTKYYSTSDLALGKEKKNSIRKSVTNLAEKASKLGDKLKLPSRSGSFKLRSKSGSLQHLDRDSSSLSPATPLQRRKLEDASSVSVRSEPLYIPSNPVRRSYSDATKSDSVQSRRSRPSLEEKSSGEEEEDEDLGPNNPFGSNMSTSPKPEMLSKSPMADDVFPPSPAKAADAPVEQGNSFGAPYRKTRSSIAINKDAEFTKKAAEQTNGFDVVDSKPPVAPSPVPKKPDRQISDISLNSSTSEISEEMNKSTGSTGSDRVIYKSKKEKEKVKKYKDSSKRASTKSASEDVQPMRNGFAKEIEEHRQRVARQPSEENITPETMFKYQDFTKKQLIVLIEQQKEQLAQKNQSIKDLEDYMDKLLLQVMETEPSILQSSRR